ncbi:MAG: nucleotidyltransferase domain-containing protein [Alphaproteobacteria bacterium]
MPEHRLTALQLQTVRGVLAPYASVIERACLFGSRATGTARPNSDIDLVLYGPLSETVVSRIWTLFDESSLAVKVDVIGYDLIDNPALKSHIDAAGQPLFTQADLLSVSGRV